MNKILYSPGNGSAFYRIQLFVLPIAFLIIAFSSCTATKDSYYFKTLKKDTTISGFVTNDFESKIKVGDNLSIVATSLSKEEDALFNSAAGEASNIAGVSGATGAGAGFLVRPDGTVLLHKLGNTKAEGFTRKELALQLQKSLAPYMKDPIVNVNYLNHKVTVLGAVNKAQVLNFSGEQIPLIDVLVSSGDITVNGKRNDVMVIREKNNEKIIKHLNLEDQSIFTSPWYYVQPNDIVYVTEDYEKLNRAERRTRIQTTLSLIASGISLIIIVVDRVIK